MSVWEVVKGFVVWIFFLLLFFSVARAMSSEFSSYVRSLSKQSSGLLRVIYGKSNEYVFRVRDLNALEYSNGVLKVYVPRFGRLILFVDDDALFERIVDGIKEGRVIKVFADDMGNVRDVK